MTTMALFGAYQRRYQAIASSVVRPRISCSQPIVGGAGLVPHHVGHRGDAVVGDDDDLQAVGEGRALGAETLRRGGAEGAEQEREREKETARGRHGGSAGGASTNIERRRPRS